MKKKKVAFLHFGDPNMSDRELINFLIYKMTVMDAQIGFIKQLLMEKFEMPKEKEEQYMDMALRDAFEQYEFDVHQFRKNKHNPEDN